MTQKGEVINEINRNNIKHSPNIGIKISQKNNNSISSPPYHSKKLFFSINKSDDLNISKNNSKIDNYKNMNIQIDRQSVEIKGGNVILNNKREIQEDNLI